MTERANTIVLATLLYTCGQTDCWTVVALTLEMVDRKEQPRRLAPFHDIDQEQAMIDRAFPGATARTTHKMMPFEMRNYLMNAGYTRVQITNEDIQREPF